jgi:NAD(P)-dependent dehydrogenase (short-subunit alcohol dehydrogenase family)
MDTDPDAVPLYPEMLSLKNRGFVVLGSGAGMGRHVCHALTQAGARVLCVDHDKDLVERIAGEVNGLPYVADLTKEAEVEGVFAEAFRIFGERFAGFVDIVGVAIIRSLRDTDEHQWLTSFQLVLHHAYLAMRIGAPYLARNGGGAITVVGSISGMLAFKRQVAYGVGKAALHQLVRAVAHEFAGDGIRVNSVAPGFVNTPTLRAKLSPCDWTKIDASIPMGRAAKSSDIAAAILFLQSDLARYVTGNIMILDGGSMLVPSIPQI